LQWQAQFSPQPLAASYHFRYLHFDVSEGIRALTFCEELSTPWRLDGGYLCVRKAE